jgi:PD-(D/E)XK nuclease superfamily
MDIYSVSYSSDKSLSRCEQQYSYKYQEGLRPKRKASPLFRGDWIHEIFKAHYRGEDWSKKFNQLIKEKWDPLFDEEKEYYGEDFPQSVRELIELHMEFYSKLDKKWKIVKCEEKISVPTKFGFPINFIVDLIVKEGKYNILVERKSHKKIPDAKVRLFNVQPHSYCYLLQKTQGIKIDQILWDYLRTEPVTAPQVKKNGELSERSIDTDQMTVRKVLKAHKIPEKQYSDLLKSLPKSISLERYRATPNIKVGEVFVRDWIERVLRFKNHKRITRRFVKDCGWDCDFYELCMLDMEKKRDRGIYIKKHFNKRGENGSN